MVFIKRIVLCLCLIAIKNIAFSQCDYKAGNTCSTAPVICDLNCLNGFQGSLFPEADVAQYLPEQPPLLCWNGTSGFGTPTNLSWFAFIAGSNAATISVTPSACVQGDGIQLGLFDDCDFSNTTIGPNLDANEFIACNTTAPYPGPVVISTTNLKPGHTYYFFVDGNNGDVCNYTVNVIAADQSGELPNPPGFIGKNDSLETCPGTKFELQPDNFNYDIEYYWKIDPPTATYPYANFTKLDSITEWRLNNPGTYTISMYAYNRCDATDTLSITVNIKEPDDEDFGDITICQNEFPYAGPIDLDYNGDGIGWLGPNIGTPGPVIHNVIRADGCRYDQKVNVLQQALQAREKVTLVDCNQIDYQGLVFTSNEFGFPYTLPIKDKNGCDSIVSIDAYILGLDGQYVSQSCNGGKVTIGYTLNSISAPSGYQLSYTWKDGSGNTIPDNDSDVTNITLDKATLLSLDLTLTVNGETCLFNEAAIQIDPTQQLPTQPIANNWEQIFCEDNALQLFEILPQNGIINYHWTVNNGASIVGVVNNRQITIDFTNTPFNTPTQICVSVENACGESSQYCSTVRKTEKPKIQINAVDTICVGEDLEISATNVSTANINDYNWTYTGAQLMSGNINGSGPLRLQYNTAGTYNVNAVASNAECISSTVNKQINVLPIVQKPMLTFQPFADKVIVSWPAVSCAQSYNCYINGIFIKNTFGLQLEIGGLITNTAVNVTIEAIGAVCACGINAETIAAKTLSCNEVKLDVQTPFQIICETDWSKDVQLNYSITGNLGNGMLVWSGSGVSNTGVIRPSTLGKGSHQINLFYEEFGCHYKDSVLINLVPTPDAKIVSEDPQCKEDEAGSVMVLPINGSTLLDYKLDGKPMNEGDLMSVGIGSHNIQIIDANNCSVVKDFVINPPTYPDVEIRKQEEPYYDNETLDFMIHDLNSSLNLIDSVVWLINGEVFCSGLCMDISIEDFESGVYNHQILVYYKHCEIRQDFEMLIKESPKVYTSNVLITNKAGTENSGFRIISNDDELEILSLDIFSRWGEKVFSKKNFIPNAEVVLWDGRFNGEYVVPGVYMYKLSYKNEKDVIVTEIKDVTVVR